MLGPIDERTPPMTPQLALRVAVIGGVALLLFAIIFFRLWFLQVLSGTKYVAQARSNVIYSLPVAAPRGEIVDASGNPLVQSVAVPSIQIAPHSLPQPVTLDLAANGKRGVVAVPIPARDRPLFTRLAKLLGMPTKPAPCKYTVYWSGDRYTVYHVRLAPVACKVAMSVSQSDYANATIKTNVPAYVQDYVAERSAQDFPGVLWQDTYVRKYALGDAGAQMLGTYGPITEQEVASKAYKGITAGNLVGQSGLEAEYNWALQGVDGKERVKVNAQGQFEGLGKRTAPVQGDTLATSIDSQLERTGYRSLLHSIGLNHGTSGAFIAMDPQTGQVYAEGSAPSYDPTQVSPSITTRELKLLDAASSQQPLYDRAIDGALPNGSTFKVITAAAALESGHWSLSDTYDDVAKFCFEGGLCLQNSGNQHYGVIDLQTALEVSDDEFFYNLGDKMEGNPDDYPGADFATDWPLQYWAAKFGLGKPTGIDLPGEASGMVGSPKLQAELWKEELDCQNATGDFAYTNPVTKQISATKLPGFVRSAKTPAVMDEGGEQVVSGGCAIATQKYWDPGDNVNTGVGQYDDLVTPAQLAVVYAAIENGGKIVTPHIGEAIESQSGTVIHRIDPAPKRTLDIDPSYLQAIRQGLLEAATGANGTSTDVMGDFPLPVYGKTGTAELGNSADSPEDAWYVCYVPDGTKSLVVAVNVEYGGFGDVAAAPVARQILSQWFLGKPGAYKSGNAGGDQT